MGNKILVGSVVDTKVGDLEEDLREGLLRRLSKELAGVVQGVSGKRRLLVRFQDGFDKDLNSNQITTTTIEKIPMDEEINENLNFCDT